MSKRSRPDIIHRRRRLGAVFVAAFAILLVIVGINAASGGTSEKNIGRSEVPTSHARAWAQDRDNRIRATADQEAFDSVLAQSPVVRHGEGRKPLVALTFDDGPGEYTPAILDVLDRFDVRATFFVIGGAQNVPGALIKEEVDRGHVVANHTVEHPAMDSLSAAGQAQQIDAQAAAIELFSGVEPKLFRPPYNAWDETTTQLLERRGMLMILWSVETDDWAKPGADAIVQRTLSAVEPGSIILMHDGGGDRSQTVEALPRIITGLRSAGYDMVTVPKLLSEDPPLSDQRP